MSNDVHAEALASTARSRFLVAIVDSLAGFIEAVEAGARTLVGGSSDPRLVAERRDAVNELSAHAADWLSCCTEALRLTAAPHTAADALRRSASARAGRPSTRNGGLTLVDNDTIESEILASRLALAVMDMAASEFTDLRSRIARLSGEDDLASNDLVLPQVLSRIVVNGWSEAGMTPAAWRTVHPVIHDALGTVVADRYRDVNHWLVSQRVMPDVDLRQSIRRARETPGLDGAETVEGAFDPTARQGGRRGADGHPPTPTDEAGRAGGHIGDQGLAVLDRLNRLIGAQVPEFANTTRAMTPASASLRAAMSEAQKGVQRRFAAAAPDGATQGAGNVTPEALLDDLRARSGQLKQAATSMNERAIIEVVALLFQSILTDERIPASVRVWFARLQMPVLRVAVGEPDFFATVDHPARRLIDRMGACVMGFDAQARHAPDLVETEIKRVVQVVEAYPDTGRRVFQTVLVEFERFLEHYFRNENEASRKGISLAQQVEQRETLAIQYTIELRRMLNEMPVQDGVREFLFQVWADVLAMSAVKSGQQSEETKSLKRAAADLIWSASAKVSREERAEVIRRLPPLLKTLRDGMQQAQVGPTKQNEHIQRLNNSLAAAFTAKAAAIPADRLAELTARLEALEELLVDVNDTDIDESMVLDLSGHESADLEVVAEGGSAPTSAMLAWARELQVGSWYALDYRGRNEGMQLVWQGMQKRLALFVSTQGRGVLFQRQRLAAFLQAGLLVPVQTESLTVQATRSALMKLDMDPARLTQ